MTWKNKLALTCIHKLLWYDSARFTDSNSVNVSTPILQSALERKQPWKKDRPSHSTYQETLLNGAFHPRLQFVWMLERFWVNEACGLEWAEVGGSGRKWAGAGAFKIKLSIHLYQLFNSTIRCGPSMSYLGIY